MRTEQITDPADVLFECEMPMTDDARDEKGDDLFVVPLILVSKFENKIYPYLYIFNRRYL
jgi:hypothetical protein